MNAEEILKRAEAWQKPANTMTKYEFFVALAMNGILSSNETISIKEVAEASIDMGRYMLISLDAQKD